MQDFPKPSMLLFPWLRVGGYGMIHATPGVGKSWLALAIAMTVAGGGRLIEWEVGEPSPVLFIDAEMSLADNLDRQNALLGSIEGINEQALDDNLLTLTKLEYAEKHPGSEWPTPEHDANRLYRWAMLSGAKLVVLDNLRGLTRVDDENSATQWHLLHDLSARLKAAGVAVLLVHHDDKHGSNYAGSGHLDVPLEARLHLKPCKSQGGAAFSLKYRKDRHGRNQDRSIKVRLAGRVEDRNLSWQITGGGEDASGADDTKDDQARQLYDTAKGGQFKTMTELGEQMGLTHPQAVTRLMDYGASIGLVATRKEFQELMKAPAESAA